LREKKRPARARIGRGNRSYTALSDTPASASTPPESSLLRSRLALVTGASRGIGYEIALGLAKAGAHVVATARTQGALEELDDAIVAATGENATLVPLDITDGQAVDRLGAAIYERWGRLDILVSNAGDLGLLTPLAHLDPKVWDRSLAVNMTATYRLVRSMDPLLRRSEGARAIFLTTGVASMPKAFWGAYAATKAGMEAIVRTYADETDNTPIRCILLSPGPMRTRMRMQAFPGEDPNDLTPPAEIVPLVIELVTEPRPDPKVEVVRYPDWAAKQG
jgi:NAD(P)-dependent dehydrogenase (short-subunit alcohol dehydrogenase family)